ncbi:MAG: UDP-N-acetylglucosamine 2-epimerase, partial [Allosphingosinicella sp.]
SFEMKRPAIAAAVVPESLGFNGRGYGVVTLHRPANVDDPAQLAALVDCLASLQAQLPLVFPVHPRTSARLRDTALDAALAEAGVRLIEPMPYVRFMSLVAGARAVITDSGGLQEETTYLGIPCFTLRESTERPITIEQGTNRLATAGNVAEMLRAALANGGNGHAPLPRPEYWDGRTAQRCVEDLRRRR